SQYIGDPDETAVPPQPAPTLTVLGNNNPALVTATINGQILTLTISAFANGNATITLQATDNDGATIQPPPSLNVVVNPAPFPPSVVMHQYFYTPGQVLSVTAPGLLTGDVGHNGTALTLQAVDNAPVHGRLFISPSGAFEYVPDGSYAFDSFSVKVSDGATESTENVNIINSADTLQAEWVTRLYSQVLGRTQEPQAAQLDTYVNDVNSLVGQVNSGTSLGQIAYDFVHSPEYYATNVIAPAYLNLLGRAADAGGLAYWVQQMQNGLTDQQLEAGFIASDEFYANAGGTNLAWVDAVYQKLLGRPADPGGQSYWQGQLASGVSRGEVALLIANSAENDSQLISADYEKFLGRAPDPSGLSYWLQQFKNGATNEDVVAGFTGSPEYYDKHS
ncbi:MAG: DUF4214 domain-containing protein, partial [Pirellulales bacterium]